MNGGRCLVVAVAIAAASVCGASGIPRFGGDGEFKAGQPDRFGGYPTTHILVRWRAGAAPPAMDAGRVVMGSAALDAVAAKWRVAQVERVFESRHRRADLASRIGLDRTYRVSVPAGTDTRAMAAAFAGADGIEFAEIDGLGGIAATIPNDPKFEQQWSLHNSGQSGGTQDADIDAPEAWDISIGSYDVIVAELDTGIQATHPDLAGRVSSGDPEMDTADDPHGHGTHVAGIIGAIGNNDAGVCGINWDVSLVLFKAVSPSGSGTESQCAAAIVRAADFADPAPWLISMSLQYYTGSQTLRDAVEYASAAGLLLMAANGNYGLNLVAYPAAFPGCMAVSATDRNDAIWPSSNYGPETDLAGPGKDVHSLWKNSGYQTLSGTSMAVPHVSGTAALIWSVNPCLSAADVEQILLATVDDLGDAGWDPRFGHGRVNAHAALRAALATATGDLNCDCSVNELDLAPFALALRDPAGYADQYPGCNILRADANADGTVNGSDIEAFVRLLSP